MKIINFFSLLIIIFSTSGCATWKKTLSSQGNLDRVVNNVITDFVNTSKLFKADDVFEIYITDKEECYVISIGGVVNKIYPRAKNIIGTYDELIPNKYVIHNNKLFYWNDPAVIIAEEIIEVLILFDQIDLDWRDTYYDMPPMVFDDGKEGVVYYICKNNFTNYKKTGTNTIKRHYKAPNLKCN